ncbi:MAG: hypothetical protein F6K41_27070 [Symploca sp. SIO3E6]|nr:hypothetical protein [Caldora sp. SIO3E6]
MPQLNCLKLLRNKAPRQKEEGLQGSVDTPENHLCYIVQELAPGRSQCESA